MITRNARMARAVRPGRTGRGDPRQPVVGAAQLRPRYPHALELDYHDVLVREFVDPATAIIDHGAILITERIAARAAASLPLRADAGDWTDARWEEDVDHWVATVKITLAERVSVPDKSQAAVAKQAKQLDLFNENEARRTFERVKSVDPITANPRIATAQAQWTKDNVKLIQSIPEKYADRVGNMIKGAVANSTRAGSFSGQLLPMVQDGLKDEGRIAKNRAMLIARTEIAKQFGNLTQIRQQSAGIESYTWATAHDDRVRPTHRANDGRVFKWTEPPIITGHPGNDYQCRCVAVAVI